MQAAVRANDLDQVIQLVSNDQSVTAKDEDARTPLHWAASCGSLKVLDWLLTQPGTVVNTQDDAGWTPLMSAVSAGHIESVVSLLNHGADANTSNENGQIPLHYHRGSWMMSELEIQAQLYFFLGRLDMAELLLEYTKDVDHVDDYGSTPLLRAVGSYPNADLIRMLLEHGAALNTCDHQGNTPLHLALLENEEAIAMELVQAGADYLTAINNEGKTCLDLAGQALKDALPRNTI